MSAVWPMPHTAFPAATVGRHRAPPRDYSRLVAAVAGAVAAVALAFLPTHPPAAPAVPVEAVSPAPLPVVHGWAALGIDVPVRQR